MTGRYNTFEVALNGLPGKNKKGSEQAAEAPLVLGLILYRFFSLSGTGSPIAEAGLELPILPVSQALVLRAHVPHPPHPGWAVSFGCGPGPASCCYCSERGFCGPAGFKFPR